MNRGKIISIATVGSNGTPLYFSLPGGGKGQVVTSRASYPYDEEFIGTGVIPDLGVYPTIEDIRIGRDRIFEKDVEFSLYLFLFKY